MTTATASDRCRRTFFTQLPDRVLHIHQRMRLRPHYTSNTFMYPYGVRVNGVPPQGLVPTAVAVGMPTWMSLQAAVIEGGPAHTAQQDRPASGIRSSALSGGPRPRPVRRRCTRRGTYLPACCIRAVRHHRIRTLPPLGRDQGSPPVSAREWRSVWMPPRAFRVRAGYPVTEIAARVVDALASERPC